MITGQITSRHLRNQDFGVCHSIGDIIYDNVDKNQTEMRTVWNEFIGTVMVHFSEQQSPEFSRKAHRLQKKIITITHDDDKTRRTRFYSVAQLLRFYTRFTEQLTEEGSREGPSGNREWLGNNKNTNSAE